MNLKCEQCDKKRENETEGRDMSEYGEDDYETSIKEFWLCDKCFKKEWSLG